MMNNFFTKKRNFSLVWVILHGGMFGENVWGGHVFGVRVPDPMKTLH